MPIVSDSPSDEEDKTPRYDSPGRVNANVDIKQLSLIMSELPYKSQKHIGRK